MSVEIGGLTPVTQYDQVTVTGTNHAATLAGTLTATLINGFVPNIGDSFTILSGPASGAFDTLNLPPLPPDRQWQVSIGSVVLTVMPAVATSAEINVVKLTNGTNNDTGPRCFRARRQHRDLHLCNYESWR